MKIEEFRSELKDKTTMQVNAIANEYIGKEYIIETDIIDISDNKIFIRDSTGKYEHIYFDPLFKDQLLAFSRSAKVVIKVKLHDLNTSNSPYRTHFRLLEISKA